MLQAQAAYTGTHGLTTHAADCEDDYRYPAYRVWVDARRRYRDMQLSQGAERVRCSVVGAIGSTESEVMAYEAEDEIQYDTKSKMTDFCVCATIGDNDYHDYNLNIRLFHDVISVISPIIYATGGVDKRLAVSVTRACGLGGHVFGVVEACELLQRKLDCIHESNQAVCDDDRWDTQLLWIWAHNQTAIEALEVSYGKLPQEIRCGVPVVIVQAKDMSWIF